MKNPTKGELIEILREALRDAEEDLVKGTGKENKKELSGILNPINFSIDLTK